MKVENLKNKVQKVQGSFHRTCGGAELGATMTPSLRVNELARVVSKGRELDT